MDQQPLLSRHVRRHALPTAGVIRTSATLAAVAGHLIALHAHASGPFPAEFDLALLRDDNGALGRDGLIAFGADPEVGRSVSSAGDLNGDGDEDFIVASPLATGAAGGEVFIVFGPAEALGIEFDLDALRPERGGDGTQGVVIVRAAPTGNLGASVAAAGDVNGDGMDDVLLGDLFANGEEPEAGEAYLLYGRDDDFPATIELESLFAENGGDGSLGVVLLGAEANDLAGRSVSAAGDVNHDGMDDILVSALFADPPDTGIRAGETYVIYGNANGFPPELSLRALRPENGGDGTLGTVFRGAAGGDESGSAVSAAGDINADGIDDLIIGASRTSPQDGFDAGTAYVVFGREDGLGAAVHLGDLLAANGGDGQSGFAIRSTASGNRWGGAVQGLGDLNADGVDDVVIGAFPNGDSPSGVVAVVFGRADGFAAEIDVDDLRVANGGDGSDGFITLGVSSDRVTQEPDLLTGGDLNGDGINDLIIAAPEAAASTGQVFVLYGRDGPYPPEFSLSSLSSAGGGDGSEGFVITASDTLRLGSSAGTLSDFNGDGINDLITAAEGISEAYIIYGRSSPRPRARIVGVDTRTVACRNLRTQQTATGSLPAVALDESFDCASLGLDFEVGDTVILQAESVSFSQPALNGEALDLVGDPIVDCTNTSSGQTVRVRVLDRRWDCLNAGFQVAPEDGTLVRIRGIVGTPPPTVELNATVVSMNVRSAACQNNTDAQTVTGEFPIGRLEETIDCLALGLTVSPDDQVVIQATGRNFGANTVTLSVEGLNLDGISGRCDNLTTGQSVLFEVPVGVDEFRCAAEGLELSERDDVTVTVRGNVQP